MCKEGQHCISDACESCIPHRSCPPGFGVQRIGKWVACLRISSRARREEPRAQGKGLSGGHLAPVVQGMETPTRVSMSVRVSRKWKLFHSASCYGYLPWEGSGRSLPMGCGSWGRLSAGRRVLKAGRSSCPVCPPISSRARQVVYCDD